MKILTGRGIKNFREAAELAFREAGADDLSLLVADLFESADATKLRSEAERNIMAAIRGRYRGNPSWDGKQWYVPVPKPGYDTRGTPHMTIELKTYLVAAGEVETTDRYYPVTLVGPIGKLDTLIIPIVLLQAILDDDLGCFAVLARSAGNTTREIPGFKPVQLADDFVARLSDVLKRKSVAAWLEEFGSQGRSIRPLVIGTLLGLQSMGATKALPLGQQQWTYELLLSALEAMAYQVSEAKVIVARAVPYLRADQTLEDAIRVILQNETKGG
ncbi:MAG: hypothetical protein FJ006_06480 [Chloroflexi bacterium]|nr:hypothetical protein [Chloroflexota bacterium]